MIGYKIRREQVVNEDIYVNLGNRVKVMKDNEVDLGE